MNVELLKDEKLLKQYEVKISAASIIQDVDMEVMERAKTFKLAGFRPGKVPLSIVKSQVGTQILSAKVDRRISEAVRDLVQEKKLNLISKPSIEVKDFKQDGDLSFTIEFKLAPSVPKIDFSNKRFDDIEVFTLKISNTDLQKEKENILQAERKFETASDDYKAKKGDALVLDFVATVDDKEFEGNKASSIRIVIGDNQFIREFEDKLVSLKKDDDVSLNVKFPADYHSKDVAGKDAVFKVKVHEVLKVSDGGGVKKFDDKFVKEKYGVSTVAEFDKMLEERMRNVFDTFNKMRIKEKIFEIVDELCDIKLDPEVIKSDVETMWIDVQKKPEMLQGKNETEAKKELEVIAQKRVKNGLVLGDLIRENEFSVDDKELQDTINAEIAKNMGGNSKEVSEFYSKQENTEKLRGVLLENKVIDFIISKISAKKVEVTVEEFNKRLAGELDDSQETKGAEKKKAT